MSERIEYRLTPIGHAAYEGMRFELGVWVADNLPGTTMRLEFLMWPSLGPAHVVIAFDTEEAAMLFKLRWSDHWDALPS